MSMSQTSAVRKAKLSLPSIKASRRCSPPDRKIFRLPMRGYFTTNGGGSWGGVDLPLPPAKGNGTDFGSDPTLAFDTQGNVFYGYIVVFFGNGNGINGTEMAVAKTTDGGEKYTEGNSFFI